MTYSFVGKPARTGNIDWKRVAAGCPVCRHKIQYHTLTAWCLKCGWAKNWTNESPKGTDGYDPVNEGVPTATAATTGGAMHDALRELKHGMPTVAEDAADLRLLDLALSYACDNEAIHMGDPDKRARLSAMLERVLTWFREDV